MDCGSWNGRTGLGELWLSRDPSIPKFGRAQSSAIPVIVGPGLVETLVCPGLGGFIPSGDWKHCRLRKTPTHVKIAFTISTQVRQCFGVDDRLAVLCGGID